jgi:hypothetical protein
LTLTFFGGIGGVEADAEADPPDFRVRRPSAMARCRRACKKSPFFSGDATDDVDLMGTSALSGAGGSEAVEQSPVEATEAPPPTEDESVLFFSQLRCRRER